MRTELAQLTKTVNAIQANGGATPDRPGTAVTLPRGTSTAGVATSGNTSGAGAKPAGPTIDDLIHSASTVLGNVGVTGSPGHSAAYAGGGAPGSPSPAVVAALEGRTMLSAVALPGKYFSREIPSTRGQPTAARQTVWKLAAKMAAESSHPELHPLGGGDATRPSSGSTRTSATSGAPDAGNAAHPPASSSGLLRRFAVQTMVNLAAAKRKSGAGETDDGRSSAATEVNLPGQSPSASQLTNVTQASHVDTRPQQAASTGLRSLAPTAKPASEPRKKDSNDKG